MAVDLVNQAIGKILDAIVEGEFSSGEALPSEGTLADWLGVSRTTMREAVRTLAERGVLNVFHGKGTYVVDPDEWTDLSTVIWWVEHTASPAQLGEYLVDVRRMLEVGASGLAAKHRTEANLVAMRSALEEFDDAIAQGNIERAVHADLLFHSLIFESTQNPLFRVIMNPLQDALESSRRHTTSIPEIRARAVVHHRQLFEYIEAQDDVAAKNEMRSHMTQTRDDISAFLSREQVGPTSA